MAIVASSRQSPIDISTTTAMFDVALENTEFNFDYKPKDFTALCRDGEGWVITVGENSSSSTIFSSCEGNVWVWLTIRTLIVTCGSPALLCFSPSPPCFKTQSLSELIAVSAVITQA